MKKKEEFKEVVLDSDSYGVQGLARVDFRATERVARKVFEKLLPVGARNLRRKCVPGWTGWCCEIPASLYRKWEEEVAARSEEWHPTPRLLANLRAEARRECGV